MEKVDFYNYITIPSSAVKLFFCPRLKLVFSIILENICLGVGVGLREVVNQI